MLGIGLALVFGIFGMVANNVAENLDDEESAAQRVKCDISPIDAIACPPGRRARPARQKWCYNRRRKTSLSVGLPILLRRCRRRETCEHGLEFVFLHWFASSRQLFRLP
jgi:hypothetical protein